MTNYLIVGARFRPPAQDVLDNLPAGTDLVLRRQPDNPYDENAVAVMLPADYTDAGEVTRLLNEAEHPEQTPLHLGFIPREHAAKLAPQMDLAVDDNLNIPDWKGKLTFGPSGGPMVSIEVKE